MGGWALVIKAGKLRDPHNHLRRQIVKLSSRDTVPTGRHELRFESEPTGRPDIPNGVGAPGRAQLYVDRKLVADTDLLLTTPVFSNPSGLSCGTNPNLAVDPPLPVTVRVHSEGEIRMAMARR
jgi:hypothetical protein